MKMIEVSQFWAAETEAFLIETFHRANETLYVLKNILEENYLKVKTEVIKKWQYLKEETPYVEKAKELLEKTRDFVEDKIEFTKEYAQLVKDTTVTTTKDVISYVNGTMAGLCCI